MKPLIILLATFAISLFVLKFVSGSWNFSLSGCIAMSVMLLFTAIGHFAFSKGMEMMLPAYIPFKRLVVYLSGIFEIAAAVGLLIPIVRQFTGWSLILFFVLILSANIAAAGRNVNYQKGTFDGPGISYLWFRIPLQIFFIAWVYCFAIIGF
jgi:uncharacterized membrane protein